MAIIGDAHSGRYFGNDFQDKYSSLDEMLIVRGMIKNTHDDPTLTDAFYACVLSYMETHWSLDYVTTHPGSEEEVGLRASVACDEYYDRS